MTDMSLLGDLAGPAPRAARTGAAAETHSSGEWHEKWQRSCSAGLGIVLIVAAGGVTVWSTIGAKPLSGVGVGGLFVTGMLLVFSGLLGVRPSSLTLGKDGASVQFVADAVKQIKESSRAVAQLATTDCTLLEQVKTAQSDQEAAAAVAKVAHKIVDGMPATADITARLRRAR